jgi:mono/diheme cytochrome c family protein
MRGIGVLCLAVLVCSAIQGSSRAQAQQQRTAADGAYTDAQAARGEAISDTKCVACHGVALAGDIAPPLVGQDFLTVWQKLPLVDLFDKILNTMPADALGTLTRPETADLVAYLLKANKFPTGNAELPTDEAALKRISLSRTATAASSAPGTTAPAVSFPPAGNLNQVMRGILFPSSNVLFDVQTQDPSARQQGARADAGTTTARYGDVYDPWMVVDAAAISLVEAAPLLMTPGRRCENGKSVPIERGDWQRYVQGLADVGRAAYRAAQTRNQATVSEVTNQVSDACANCHRVYRDTPSAATRCIPPP